MVIPLRCLNVFNRRRLTPFLKKKSILFFLINVKEKCFRRVLNENAIDVRVVVGV